MRSSNHQIGVPFRLNILAEWGKVIIFSRLDFTDVFLTECSVLLALVGAKGEKNNNGGAYRSERSTEPTPD